MSRRVLLAVVALAAASAEACAQSPGLRAEPRLPATLTSSDPPPPPPAPEPKRPDAAPDGPVPSGSDATDSAPSPNAGDTLDDDVPTPEYEETPGGRVPETPIDGWSKARIDKALAHDASALGSMSIGTPDAGALLGGVQLKSGRYWSVVPGAHAWGTKETINDLIRCIDKVNEQFPDSPKMFIGDISAKRGGHLYPHVSHQAGRDADVSYYYLNGAGRWYLRATAKNLDRARTWAFVRAVITETDIQLILMDRSIQKLLEDYALKIGEDPQWLNDVFRGRPGKLRPLIIHWPGHATHMHLRFYSPVAQQTAHLAYPLLVKHGLIHRPTYFVERLARKGDTLARLAARYHTTVRAIMHANRLHKTLIIAHRAYKIPRRGGVAETASVVIPPRRLPPPRITAKNAESSGGGS